MDNNLLSELCASPVQGGMLDQCANNISNDLYQCFCIDLPRYISDAFMNFQNTSGSPDLPKSFGNNWIKFKIPSSPEVYSMTFKDSVFRAGLANFIVYSPQILNSIYPLPIGSIPIDLGFVKITLTIIRDISGGLDGISYSLRTYYNLDGLEFCWDFVCLAIQNLNDS